MTFVLEKSHCRGELESEDRGTPASITAHEGKQGERGATEARGRPYTGVRARGYYPGTDWVMACGQTSTPISTP